MGKATIVEEIGEGQYTVALDYGSEIIDARVAAIDARVSQINSELSDLSNDIATARADYTAAQSALNDAIDALRGAIESGSDYTNEADAAKEAGIAAVQASAELEKLLSDKGLLDAEKSGLLLEKARLQALAVESQQDVWCVDYSLGATGEVATVEVPGDATLTLIAPQAPAPATTDGRVLAREVQQGYQLFFNAALLPGWQKWMPLWRLGEITALDGDLCDVALDTVTSTGQALDINQAPDLAGVPIEYMSCNGAAFNVGDRVVVAFTDQDWQQPKVIGFESEPRACAGLLLHWNDYVVGTPNPMYMASYGASGWSAREVDIWGYYGGRGWTNGVRAVSWDEQLNGSGAVGVYFRGARVWGFNAGQDADTLGLYDRSAHVVLYVVGAWAVDASTIVVVLFKTEGENGLQTVVLTIGDVGGVPTATEGSIAGFVASGRPDRVSQSIGGNRFVFAVIGSNLYFELGSVYHLSVSSSGALSLTTLRATMETTTNTGSRTDNLDSRTSVRTRSVVGTLFVGATWSIDDTYSLRVVDIDFSYTLTFSVGVDVSNSTMSFLLTANNSFNGAPLPGNESLQAAYNAAGDGEVIAPSEITINSLSVANIILWPLTSRQGLSSNLAAVESQTYGGSSSLTIYEGATSRGSASGRVSVNVGQVPTVNAPGIGDIDNFVRQWNPETGEHDDPDARTRTEGYFTDWYLDVGYGVRLMSGDNDINLGVLAGRGFMSARTLSGNTVNAAEGAADIASVFPAGVDASESLIPIVPY